MAKGNVQNNAKKKVLFTSHLAHVVKFNAPYMKWFMDKGWEVHYASLDEEEIPFCHKHFKICFDRSPFSAHNIQAYSQLKALLAAQHYDIIHCHTPMGGVVTRLAAAETRKKGTKVIYTAHGFHFYKGAPIVNWLLYYPVEKYLAGFTDCLVTINNEDYDLAIKKRFKAKSIEKIDGVGVDLTRFKPVQKEEKARLREEYGFSRNDFILTYVAEFSPDKNHAFLVNTVPKLRENIKNLKVLFAGKGKTMKVCQALSDKLKIHKTVKFMGYRNDVEKLFGLSDIAVSVSRREGLGLNLIEGMACGLPVVCSNVRGHRDLTCNGKNGYLFELGHSEQFIDCVVKVYSGDFGEDTHARISLRANKYSLDRAIKSMGLIYGRYMYF